MGIFFISGKSDVMTRKRISREWLKLLTRGDKILIISIAVFGLMSFFFISQLQSAGEFVIVSVDGVEQYHGALSTNDTITVHGNIGRSIIEIQGGKVRMLHSDCPTKVCVRSGAIHQQGEVIVCAPNKVLIQITGKKKANFDVITK